MCFWRYKSRKNIPQFSSQIHAYRTINFSTVSPCYTCKLAVLYMEFGDICCNNDILTHTRLMALCPGLPGWAGTRKVKPIWIFLKQEIVSGIGISWAICKSASRSRQITRPAPHHSKVFFTSRMPFLPPNQQCQSTVTNVTKILTATLYQLHMFCYCT